ncbi:hypothetical protein CSH63_04090 [Micromonospora tulbaghiae]|uniref:Transposase of IS4/5 family n=1 Tax=Micromonospora tulbaghiae TaxID=479978 RepID=A0A386WGM7_9ACTN|nr:hypothetical protein CSH63_04090 [Micromonospora tulbaghiae]
MVADRAAVAGAEHGRPAGEASAAGDRQRDPVRGAVGVPVALSAGYLPPWQTVYWYFTRWEEAGVTEKLLATLRIKGRGATAPPAGAVGGDHRFAEREGRRHRRPGQSRLRRGQEDQRPETVHHHRHPGTAGHRHRHRAQDRVVVGADPRGSGRVIGAHDLGQVVVVVHPHVDGGRHGDDPRLVAGPRIRHVPRSGP